MYALGDVADLALLSGALQAPPSMSGSSGLRGRTVSSLCRAGTFFLMGSFVFRPPLNKERCMNGLIYLIGLIVVILAVLSFFGLR
jgi:hypothetical protein